MRGVMTGVFLLIVLVYSSNAGLLDGLKKQKAIAQSVNCELKKEQNIL